MNPYLIIASLVGALALAVGGFVEGRHYESLTWAKALSEQKLDAAAKLTAAVNANAAADAKNSELANRLDQEHANAIADAAASRDNFTAELTRRIAERVRETERRVRGSCPTTAEAPHPGVRADVANGGDRGPVGPDIAAGQRLRDYALELQTYAVACHSWAIEVGR